jgi:hypothetical protein
MLLVLSHADPVRRIQVADARVRVGNGLVLGVLDVHLIEPSDTQRRAIKGSVYRSEQVE